MRRSKLSHKDTLRRNDAAQRFYSAMSGKPIPEGVLSNVKASVPRIRKPSSPDRVLERDVLKAIMAALKAHPYVIRVQRRTVGVFTGANGTPISVGSRGEPDITGLVRGPQSESRHTVTPIPFEIEVKREGKNIIPGSAQDIRMAKSKAMGIRCGVAHSVDEAISIIEGKI